MAANVTGSLKIDAPEPNAEPVLNVTFTMKRDDNVVQSIMAGIGQVSSVLDSLSWLSWGVHNAERLAARAEAEVVGKVARKRWRGRNLGRKPGRKPGRKAKKTA